MVGKQRHLMRKEQFVAKACPQLKVVEEVKRPIQHLRHGIERENVREERRQHVWHFATLQELIHLHGKCRIIVSHDAKRQRSGDSARVGRSEEHTSELQSLMRISYAVFC